MQLHIFLQMKKFNTFMIEKKNSEFTNLQNGEINENLFTMIYKTAHQIIIQHLYNILLNI